MARWVTRVALHASALGTGLFTGLLWTFAVGVDPMLKRLDASGYARAMQTLIGTIDRGIPPVLVIANLAPIVALVGLRRRVGSRAFALTATGFSLFAVGVMVFTVTLNVPINRYIQTWSVESPPDDWEQDSDRWDALNWIRTPISVVAFLCYLLALDSSLSDRDQQPGERK